METQGVIKEELTKSEVQSMINTALSGKDTEKLIKNICDEVLENMFKVLWQRKGFWKH